ncbi:MAG TPA: chromate efflux transporter [Solirubrobacteraceae bacterium]|nr:chromate efflux transporter [Solirubrobacteraceae bacterium]
MPTPADPEAAPSLAEIAREWTRIGCTGFGGPPTHIAMLHALCVERRGWLDETQFEHALAATNLLPGPSSTQLAIYCAWRLRGTAGALLGGACFIVPGLLAILALSVLFLAGSPPDWARGAGLGAGSAVAAVAARVGGELALSIWRRARGRGLRARIALYSLAGAAAAALAGPWLVLVLLACGAIELGRRRLAGELPLMGFGWALPAAIAATGDFGALAWTALKVGALAFGGGFVIVPLMEADAVGAHHWMTHAQFLNAVALGQITPGPLVQTVAAVGYAEGGIGAGLLAALIAFAPSFSFVLVGADRFERLLADARIRAFLAGAAPATAGAIVGAAIPLARALSEGWQYALLAASAIALIALRRSIVLTLLGAGAIGSLVALLGGPLPA